MRLNVRTPRMLGGCLAIVTVLLLARPVGAGIISVASRADLAGNDLLNWGSLGASAANPFSITSAGGLDATVSATDGYGNLLNSFSFTHSVSQGGTGQFPAGTDLITGPSNNTEIFLNFAQPIQGLGLDIDPSLFTGGVGGTATQGHVQMLAFDSTRTLLGGSDFSLRYPFDNNGVPQFLGVRSDSENIKLVELDFFALNIQFGTQRPNGSVIDDVSLVTSAPSAPVPEPSTLVLLGAGLLGLGGYGWWRRGAPSAV